MKTLAWTVPDTDRQLLYDTWQPPAGVNSSGLAVVHFHGSHRRTEADQRIISHARKGGMPWIFGFEPAELPEYLAARGLTLIEEVGAPDYQRRYLDPISRRMKIFEGERVMLAQIAGEVTT